MARAEGKAARQECRLYCIEPHWVHGKKAVMEPAQLLTAQEAFCATTSAANSSIISHKRPLDSALPTKPPVVHPLPDPLALALMLQPL